LNVGSLIPTLSLKHLKNGLIKRRTSGEIQARTNSTGRSVE
jgi:hypothetical protein